MKNMERRKILLQCPCTFTRIGIMDLLNGNNAAEKSKSIVSVSSLAQAESMLTSSMNYDVVILTLNGLYYNAAEFLEILSCRIPRNHPASKVVIFSDDKCIDSIRHYLQGLESISTILDTNESIEKIQSELAKLDWHDRVTHRSATQFTCVLSTRELTILKKLLYGKSIMQVAKELALNYKTVSFYKRSAMNKLGIRTLQPLLITF